MRRIIVFGLALFIVFVFLYKIGSTQEKTDVSFGIDVGERAKDFTLKDINDSQVSLNDYIGKNVIFLVFSTTWCPSCNKEIPELIKLHDKYSEEGLKIIDVFIQEDKNKVGRVVSRNAIPYTVLLDLYGEIGRQYKIRGVPTLMVIDKDGIIRRKGYPPSSRFVPLFEDLLKELR